MRPITELTGRYRLDEPIAAGSMGIAQVYDYAEATEHGPAFLVIRPPSARLPECVGGMSGPCPAAANTGNFAHLALNRPARLATRPAGGP